MAEGARLESVCTAKVVPRVRIPLSPPEVTKVTQKKLNLGGCPNKLLKGKYKSIFRAESLEIRDWQNVVALFVK